MEMMQAAANEVLVNIALGVISLVGSYALYGIYKLTEKAKVQMAQVKDESARRRLENALADLEKLAKVTVGALEQTTASALREAVKDGKADRRELEALAHRAKAEVAAAIGPEARRVITENLGSFDDFVTKLIEECVLEIKAISGQ